MNKAIAKMLGAFKSSKKNYHLPNYQTYFNNMGDAVWSGRSYQKFANEAYIRNVIAHQSIKKIACSAASVKMLVKQENQNSTKLSKLISYPNPYNSYSEFFESVYSYKLISGNSFILALTPNEALPKELHSLRPDRVSILAGRDSMPSGYRYKISETKSRDYSADNVLHLKYFHPYDDWYGLSPIEAASYSIDQHNQAGTWNQALLQNGARPSGALVVKPGRGETGVLSEDQYHRIKAQINDHFSGSANAGKPILLEGGLEWKEMSLSPKDMDYIEMKNSAARDIALAFGVPPQLLGIPGDNTYTNLAEARLALWEQTIIPLVEKMVDALNNWLSPMFGVRVYADLDNVSALSVRKESQWARVAGADFLSADEKRKILGIE
jgi:HK97 family phage portal protein